MSGHVSSSSFERRSFLSRLSAAVAGFAAAVAGGPRATSPQSPINLRWQAERHKKGSNLLKPPGARGPLRRG